MDPPIRADKRFFERPSSEGGEIHSAHTYSECDLQFGVDGSIKIVGRGKQYHSVKGLNYVTPAILSEWGYIGPNILRSFVDL